MDAVCRWTRASEYNSTEASLLIRWTRAAIRVSTRVKLAVKTTWQRGNHLILTSSVSTLEHFHLQIPIFLSCYHFISCYIVLFLVYNHKLYFMFHLSFIFISKKSFFLKNPDMRSCDITENVSWVNSASNLNERSEGPSISLWRRLSISFLFFLSFLLSFFLLIKIILKNVRKYGNMYASYFFL